MCIEQNLSRVEAKIEKFEDSKTKIVKLELTLEETKKLVELLEKSTIRNNDDGA
jgi:hypothetical protein